MNNSQLIFWTAQQEVVMPEGAKDWTEMKTQDNKRLGIETTE